MTDSRAFCTHKGHVPLDQTWSCSLAVINQKPSNPEIQKLKSPLSPKMTAVAADASAHLAAVRVSCPGPLWPPTPLSINTISEGFRSSMFGFFDSASISAATAAQTGSRSPDTFSPEI